MGTGIVVCGCNGSGKSTLGRALAEKLQYKFIDIEDCYFSKADGNSGYAHARSHEEAKGILLNEVNSCDHFVLAAVKGNFGEELLELYRCAVLVSVPKEIRMERVRNRSFQKFGDRMLPGGDLYEKEEQFFDMVASRTEQPIREWLRTVKCPVIQVDGTKAIGENVQLIAERLQAEAQR